MKLISQIQDKMKRHQERNQSLGYRYVIAESIQFLDTEVWKKFVKNGSIFLDQKYLIVNTKIEKLCVHQYLNGLKAILELQGYS